MSLSRQGFCMSVVCVSSAVALLVQEPSGSQVGLRNIQLVSGAHNYDRMVNDQFAGRYLNQDESIFHLSKYRLDPLEKVVVVSRMLGPDGIVSIPGMMLFENLLGGRVGVIPQNGSSGNLAAVGFRG